MNRYRYEIHILRKYLTPEYGSTAYNLESEIITFPFGKKVNIKTEIAETQAKEIFDKLNDVYSVVVFKCNGCTGHSIWKKENKDNISGVRIYNK